MQAMHALEVIGLVIAALLSIGGIVAVVWVVGRFQSVEKTLDLQARALDSAGAAYKQLEEQQREERRVCESQLAELRARQSVLEGELAERLVTAVAKAWRDYVREAG